MIRKLIHSLRTETTKSEHTTTGLTIGKGRCALIAACPMAGLRGIVLRNKQRGRKCNIFSNHTKLRKSKACFGLCICKLSSVLFREFQHEYLSYCPYTPEEPLMPTAICVINNSKCYSACQIFSKLTKEKLKTKWEKLQCS